MLTSLLIADSLQAKPTPPTTKSEPEKPTHPPPALVSHRERDRADSFSPLGSLVASCSLPFSQLVSPLPPIRLVLRRLTISYLPLRAQIFT